MSRRHKLKSAAFQLSQTAAVHDRQATELPFNAMTIPTLVDDPLDRSAQIVTTCSLRDDPLGWMFHHKQLDIAQYRAGRRFQQLYQAAEIGQLKGFALKDAVDGGGITPDIVTEYGRRCRKQLIEIAYTLKQGFYSLLCDVLGRGMYLYQAAGARGIHTKRGIEYLGVRFRGCLELLAREFGYA
jgi:hypothetical protein